MKRKTCRIFFIVLILFLLVLRRIPPPKKGIHLITQWYADGNATRYQDLYYALDKNIKNKHIKQIHLLQEADFDTFSFPFKSKKIRMTKLPTRSRLLASQALRYAQANLRGEIVILANLDIYFDNSISLLYESDLNRYTSYFLSRTNHFNHSETECKYPFMGSMDSYIWIPPLPNKLLDRTDFALGSWGIENRLLFEFEQVGILGRNPCESIKTWHIHSNAYKNGPMPQVNLDKKSSVAFPDTLKTRFKSDYRNFILINYYSMGKSLIFVITHFLILIHILIVFFVDCLSSTPRLRIPTNHLNLLLLAVLPLPHDHEQHRVEFDF